MAYVAFLVLLGVGIYNERISWRRASLWIVLLGLFYGCAYLFRWSPWAVTAGFALADGILLLVVADWETLGRKA